MLKTFKYVTYLFFGFQVNVKMKDMKTGNEFMFSRPDFLDRKFLMQEIYQNFQEGEKDSDKKGVCVYNYHIYLYK